MDSPRRSRNRVACRRCQRRKIRCDGNLPSCSSCKKAGVDCVNDGKQEVSRLYMANIENRMRWLESIVQETRPDVDITRGPFDESNVLVDDSLVEARRHINADAGLPRMPSFEADRRNIQENITQERVQHNTEQRHEIGLVSLSSGGGPRYIGPSSGYFVARRILSDAANRKSRTMDDDNNSVSMNLTKMLNIPASLPPEKEHAVELSVKYFRTVHLIYPFLHEHSHMEAINRVYSLETQSPFDMFQVFMVLAIAALNISRQCKVHLPVEGYYTAAMRHIDYICGNESVTSLQSLLLLMVYALHNPSCNLNIWTLNYQCLASVVDLGLQRDIRASTGFQISTLEQEMRTRVFWVAYSFDRIICTMMGRPIGLRDEACELRLPSVVTDCDIPNTDGIGQVASQLSQSPPLSYSIHLFKLARINSEIKYVTQSVSRNDLAYAYPPIETIHEWQQGMIHSLEQWVLEIPHQDNDNYGWVLQACKCRYYEVMILLLRPSPNIPSPSEKLLDSCFHHAIDLLSEFGALYRSGNLFYSRLVVHSILLGTLVILHCIWKVPSTAAYCQIDKLATELNTSQNILSSIGEYWHEANRARDCVQELSNLTLQRLLKIPPTVDRAGSPTVERNQSNPIQNQVASQIAPGSPNIQHTGGLLGNGPECPQNLPNHNHAYRQEEEKNVTSDFLNLFDDFLQGDFQGCDTAFNIDSIMWDLFR